MITEHDLQAFGYWSHETQEPQKTLMEMVREFAEISGQEENSVLYETLVVEEFKEWQEEWSDTEADLKELADLVYVIYGYANVLGYDLDEALRRVHANNLGRIRQPDGTIKRREDGKIEKNKSYPKVKLSDLLG